MIPLFSPLRQNEPLFDEIQDKFNTILRSGHYILGETVSSFEKDLASQLDYKHAIGCASGTDALILALRALNLEKGAHVITSAYSFIASVTTVDWAGYHPILVDVDPVTGNLTAEAVEKALTPKTRAVVAVDLYGRQSPMGSLRKLCDEKGLSLIEDGAQSIGVPNRGADFYTVSFYPTKNVGAIGDAGAVLTDDADLADAVRQLSQHGAQKRDEYVRVGTNARLDALQAAILDTKLPHVSSWTQKRTQLAQNYLEAFESLAATDKLILPPQEKDPKNHVWSLFTVVLPERRNQIAEAMRAEGVGVGIYYPKALHRQSACSPYGGGDCPNADSLAATALSLPLFPELSPSEQETVIGSLSKCLSQ